MDQSTARAQAASSGKIAPAYGLRPGAEEFPLQIILSTIYPCNLGCPFCPYTDGNSEIRKFYHAQGGDLIPSALFRKIAEEAAPYKAFLRCTGGGEPLLHPDLVNLIEGAKKIGARLWLNTNGTPLWPKHPRTKRNLERLLECDTDLIEFSVDAGDAETYARTRPPRVGPAGPERWEHLVSAVRYALEYRKKIKAKTRLVCSIIMDELMRAKINAALRFWLRDVGVDEVIQRKYLTWDHNTTLSFNKAYDPGLYARLEELNGNDGPALPPCVWPFERMNIDTLGRVSLCGQDISFSTSSQFPNIHDATIKEVWQGPTFRKYREMHLASRGERIAPCSDCSAWKAGIRDWNHGWLKVLKTAENKRDKALGLSSTDVAEVGVATDIVRHGDLEEP